MDFPRLDGGLNIRELDYRLENNQSPEVKNLWWQDGVLQCRDGQTFIFNDTSKGAGYTCYDSMFYGYAFFHIGNKLYYSDLHSMVELYSGVPENRGTFFRYLDWLFYKNRGAFIKITYKPDAERPFSASDLIADAYVPTLVLNAKPSTGSGDLYQPENRLTPQKRVHYNAAYTELLVSKTADGETKEFTLGYTSADQLTEVAAVYFGNTLVPYSTYEVDLSAGKVTFLEAPPDKTVISFELHIGVTLYQLPVKEIDSVDKVLVDGKELKNGSDYAVDLAKGTIAFVKAPPTTDPPTNNTVQVTFSKDNEDAKNAILSCPYAMVAGGQSKLCILLGGCKEQPNAVFWNSNDDLSMNPAYWPMPFYALAGDTEDPVSGFGKQYSDIILLKERSLGKLTFGIEDVDGRDSISFTFENINSKTGCDLPWSIQLIENNLVFCNTYQGVHVVRSSSAAYENNVECISKNINGTDERHGLLFDTRQAGMVSSFDDDSRYWICANGHVYVWDYIISAYSNPSWFYFDNIFGIAYLRDEEQGRYHMDLNGRITKFQRDFLDYGKAIEKVYQFPTQHFGRYDLQKDVMYVIITSRSDTDTTMDILYQCDYGDWADRTPIRAYSWKLVPRNLLYRYLGVMRYAIVAKRKPGLKHIRHFGMRASNYIPGNDMAIVSAQIYYRYSAGER